MNFQTSRFNAGSWKNESGASAVCQIIIIVVILALGGLGYNYLARKEAKPRRKPPQKIAPMVRVQTLTPVTMAVKVAAMGTVRPAREMTLKSRVAGQVVHLSPHFTPGGLLKAGEEVVRIDDADYTIAVIRAQGSLTEAQHALNVEMGHQQVARKEWELLNGQATDRDANQELALRKSHLAKARAQVAAAQAALEKARLDLGRTRLSAPFNAMVRTRRIEEGSYVGAQENLATLVGTDTYWVQVSLPVNRLAWLQVPRNGDIQGSPAEIRHTQSGTYGGRVIRLLGDLSDTGRMARLLVEIPDPLGLKSRDAKNTPLLLGEYVRITITGKELADVYAIPRTALRDNQYIWLAQPDNTLEIRSVAPLWRDAEHIFLKKEVRSGERLIVSELAGPVTGMPLKIAGEAGENAAAATRQASADPAFQRLDSNADGRLELDELARIPESKGTPRQIMGKLDQNGDGTLSPEEFAARRKGQSAGEG